MVAKPKVYTNNNTILCYCQHIFVFSCKMQIEVLDMKYVYERIRDLREDKDETQADIAKLLNVHLTQYRRWETGESEIPVHIVIELCKYYKVSSDYILGIV